MIRAYTVIDTAAGTSEKLCAEIRDLDGVVEAHVVAGDFDILVELEEEQTYDLQRVLASKIRPLEGVGTTRTTSPSTEGLVPAGELRASSGGVAASGSRYSPASSSSPSQ